MLNPFKRLLSRRATRSVRGPDRIGLVGFHNQAFVIARPAEAHAAWLQERIRSLHQRIGEATNITAGIRAGVALLREAPASALRRLWLLSDGEPNRDVERLGGAVDEARRAYVNINSIGFGDRFDERVLRAISAGTHRGRFVSVQSLRQLIEVLVRNSGEPARHWHGRSEYTVIAVDLSLSMREGMGGRTKIEVVQEAILQLLFYKQELFSR